jgi:flagellar protein FliS
MMMYETPYSTSLETRVHSATRLELVVMLYDAAVEAVESARSHLAGGRIKERSLAITKAAEILNELSQSLHCTPGDELSARLSDLYTYMRGLLFDANIRQSDEGLAETGSLLKTLREGWAEAAAHRPENVFVAAAAGAGETQSRYSWSA